MKKVYHILFIFTTVCLWSSCANLDLDPLDTGSRDSWYSSEDEIQRSIGGLYRTVFFTLNGNESTIDYSPWSDDNQSRASLNFITGGTINGESDQVKKRWQNGYKAIARANILLEKLEDANSVGISEEKKQLYRAQTLFVRATQYAILTSLFGDVVYIDKEISIDEAFEMGRTDREEVMENVYKDLDEAAHYLPETYGTQREFATKGAAYAIKARYALYNEDWELAAQAAKKCMDLQIYELHPDFEELFIASTHHAKENILSWPRSVELKNYLDVGAAISYCPRNRGGYASEYPSWELFCSFLCTDGLPIDESPLFDPQNPFKNRDPRCTATIVEFGTEHVGVIYNPNPNISRVWSAIAGKEITNLDCKTGSQYASYNGLLRKKGVDELWINDGTFKVDPDFVFIRYGEVLLTYAEAKIEANDIDQSVLDAINQVRARAYKKDYAAATGYPKVTTQDRDKLRQIVRIERRMELAFEGSIRYMDIIRWKLAEKVLNLPNYGLLDKDELINKVVNKNKWFFPYTPEIDEDGIADFTPMYNEGLIKIIVQRNFDTAKNYLWPIPSQEIITNPNLGQNDNY